MHVIFLGVNHKQLEIFQTESNPPTRRLKGFQALIDEADKNKGASLDKVKELLKKECVTLVNLVCQSLKE